MVAEDHSLELETQELMEEEERHSQVWETGDDGEQGWELDG